MKKHTKQLLIIFGFIFTQSAFSQSKIGVWKADDLGLPVYEYTADLPLVVTSKSGKVAKTPNDPWFIMGNYRGTVFPHVSGTYELLNGERVISRINQGSKPNSGGVLASINDSEDNKNYNLAGMESLAINSKICKRTFGTGFARYQYNLDNAISCDRTLSSKPSQNPKDGISAIVITVVLKNNTAKTKTLTYKEDIQAHYTPVDLQRTKEEYWPIQYLRKVETNSNGFMAKCEFQAKTADGLLLGTTEKGLSRYEGFPPAIFIGNINKDAQIKIGNEKKTDGSDWLTSTTKVILKANEQKTFQLIVGYTFEKTFQKMEQMAVALKTPTMDFNASTYRAAWQKVLPNFKSEKDITLKQELIWDAYCLETMAQYSQFYDETKIPQGMTYDYDWGLSASARDHLQHIYPLCYYNPKLAKSALRFQLKKVTPWGEFRLIEQGNGSSTTMFFNTSDQQVYLFLALSEYLKATKDYAFLDEKITFYPASDSKETTVKEVIKRAFQYLRDDINVGGHGLVHLRCADWNDLSYFMIKDVSYPDIFMGGESQLTSAQAVVSLGELSNLFEKSGKAELKPYIESFRKYRTNIWNALNKDWGDRPFLNRYYVNGKAYGDEQMWIEPQAFALHIPEAPLEKRKALYKEIINRVGTGEKLMLRQQEKPVDCSIVKAGRRDNGGLWYSLNGPVITGVAQWDKVEAMRLLKMMTFDNYAKQFPGQWAGQWTAPDVFDSSLMDTEGLSDQTEGDIWTEFAAFCAHPHAWKLFCYYKIKE